eukprot:TRINITY_DN28127_c0_g1_i1.p1 TRINITY_DN28127_c0_g1~~TRINITY_DN28127_c0_g1_i1.p1  ORF type:complete len:219 (-),score=74.80 TRINITY_DN28127_c0_g1_i1:107-688(-)
MSDGFVEGGTKGVGVWIRNGGSGVGVVGSCGDGGKFQSKGSVGNYNGAVGRDGHETIKDNSNTGFSCTLCETEGRGFGVQFGEAGVPSVQRKLEEIFALLSFHLENLTTWRLGGGGDDDETNKSFAPQVCERNENDDVDGEGEGGGYDVDDWCNTHSSTLEGEVRLVLMRLFGWISDLGLKNPCTRYLAKFIM